MATAWLKKELIKIDKAVFFPALIVTLIMAVAFTMDAETSATVLDKIHTFMTNELGWFFLLATFAVVIFCIYMAVSKFGKVVLGDVDSKPEFSTMTWLGMIFTSGTGGSVLYLGAVEWIWIMQAPPFGLTPGSEEAARWASAFGMFHWGPSAWAWYIACAIPIAYTMYVKKRNNLKISELVRPLLKKKTDGILGHTINFLFMFGIIGGVMTSIALGTPLISSTFSYVFNIEVGNPLLDTFVIFLWTFIPIMTLVLGLKRGVSALSDWNIRLDVLMLLGITFLGPLSFILNQSVDGLGLMLQNFVYMSFSTDVIRNTGFPQTWTIFYFSWWVVYALPYGLFIAKISKGRTIRGLVCAGLIAGSLGCMLFYMVLPGLGISLQLSGQVDLLTLMNEQGRGEVVHRMLDQLPMSALFIVLFGVITLMSYITGQCAVGYSLASATQKELKPDDEPSKANAAFWLILAGVVSLALYFINPVSLKPLQTISILTGLPLCFVIYAVVHSFVKTINKDMSNESVTEDKAGRIFISILDKPKQDMHSLDKKM